MEKKTEKAMKHPTFTKTEKRLIAGAFALLIVHSIIIATRVYSIIPGTDVLMHFTGGLLVAAFFVARFKSLFPERSKPKARGYIIITILAATALVGVLWELFEWGIDTHLISGFMGDLDDTMLDFIMDLLGASVIAFWTTRKQPLSS